MRTRDACRCGRGLARGRVTRDDDGIADENRRRLALRDVVALNIMGAPGAGKSALIARTVSAISVALTTGASGSAPVVWTDPKTSCHVDATSIADGLDRLDPGPGALFFIENGSDVACPALFDLGERATIFVMSTTEGDETPLERPHVLGAADALVLNKIDLLPYVPFDVDRCLVNARRVKPSVRVFTVSAIRGDGLSAWLAWLRTVERGASRVADATGSPRS